MEEGRGQWQGIVVCVREKDGRVKKGRGEGTEHGRVGEEGMEEKIRKRSVIVV